MNDDDDWETEEFKAVFRRLFENEWKKAIAAYIQFAERDIGPPPTHCWVTGEEL